MTSIHLTRFWWRLDTDTGEHHDAEVGLTADNQVFMLIVERTDDGLSARFKHSLVQHRYDACGVTQDELKDAAVAAVEVMDDALPKSRDLSPTYSPAGE